MDKIGEANKPFEARVEDMMEDERQKEQEKTDTKPADDDDKGIDTNAFLMTEMKFGLDFVFRMSDPVLPGEHVPDFACKGLVGDGVKMVTNEDYKGNYFVMVFYPKDFTEVGEDTLNLMADLVANEELGMKVLVISTDSVETHRAWAESREGGAPITMLGDRTGEVARTFGVLDTVTHLAYSAMFLVDKEGVVQVVKVTGRGGLGVGGVGEVLDLAREAFAVEKTEDKVEETT